jgi:hypothetical protein
VAGAGWPRWPRLGHWWRAEEKLAGAKEGRLASEGEHAADLTGRWGERACGLGERRRADQGRTRVRVHFARVLARVVIHPSLLFPWSVHKISSPLYKLVTLCGGHRIWPTGFKDLEL